ncbi:MAG: glutaredoxin family protein [Romboutsia sp.]|uniref:glutaredoxin family protein n=1 Tax=Romboutsia sp. TaxID=1965302 RepID=UPI003F3EECC3
MNEVEIYTSDTCPQCIKAKDFLKSNNIEYIEKNISKDSEARKDLIRMGYMSIPFTIINGQHVLGFDLNRMKTLLEI